MADEYGIRTLLMSDVVGSTRLWVAHPEAMPRAIERMETLAETAIGAEGGELVKRRGEGDSLFCTFDEPRAAARAARAFVRALRAEAWPDGVSLRVRIAIHCGLAHERGGDLFGPMPNRCARLREIAYGDQILISGAARGQIGSATGFALRDLGRHRLRDLDESESIYQLLAHDLPDGFPALRSLTSLRNNLPIQYTSFVGRETLRRNLLEGLRTDRLTTLTGFGGSGKTRLSIQLGADAIEDFPDGVWFIGLADAVTEFEIARRIGEACGHPDLPDPEALATLTERLRGQSRCLLVLDNAEHALGPVGRVVSALLGASPEIRIAVTSRVPLHLRGERVYRVPPLTVPPKGETDVTKIATTEAVALFIDRARLHLPEFTFRDSNCRAVAEIARRLDGIPLCLEMAASHVGYLGVDQIDARLHDRFALLEGDDANAPPRHRTMRETIAWQYDTLLDEEKCLLQRLAAFVGGFTLDAAETVGGTPPIHPERVLRHVRALVDKSLIVATPHEGEMRYRLLETIAQFASDQSERYAEAAIYALVEWAERTADQAHAGFYGPDHDEWVDRIDCHEASLKRALDWSLTGGDPRSCGIALRLTRYWHYRGRFLEGRNYLERAARLANEPMLRHEFDNALGVFYNRLGDQEAAEAAFRRALLTPGLDAPRRARILANLAIMLNDQGKLEAARNLYAEAIPLANGSSDESLQRLVLFNCSLLLIDLNETEEAETTLLPVSRLYHAAEDATRSALCEEAFANIAIERDDFQGAAKCLVRAWDRAGQANSAQFVADCLIDAAWIAMRSDDPEIAGRLLGAHLRLQDEMRAPSAPRKRRIRTDVERFLEAKGRAGASVAEGRLMTTTSAVAVAENLCSECATLASQSPERA